MKSSRFALVFASLLVALWGIPNRAAALPEQLTQDARKPKIVRVDRSLKTLPVGVKRSLQSIFNQRQLSIADPHQPFRDTDIIVNAATAKLPTRRLALGFGTQDFYYVYYRAGGAEDAGKLLVFKNAEGSYEFLWGGVEFREDPSTPHEILRRIRNNSFNDSKKFFW